ncbi:hypothetical protein WT15_19580 [Burkholderia stagnalis]|nr:hypothetical protein WT15_19580 [Burkholderia stagnalis]KWO34057.1 hypothetical protein WT96_20290 [Burkholderia stagnalis]KWO41437.1 hypothetical protein WT95_02765 [Burkholderia stagnalis]
MRILTISFSEFFFQILLGETIYFSLFRMGGCLAFRLVGICLFDTGSKTFLQAVKYLFSVLRAFDKQRITKRELH